MTTPPERSNRVLLAPYVLPYLLYVGLAAVPEAWIGRSTVAWADRSEVKAWDASAGLNAWAE